MPLKQEIADLLRSSLREIEKEQELTLAIPNEIRIKTSHNKLYGDYSTNIAMMLAKRANTSSQQLAEMIVSHISNPAAIKKIEIAGPGFINFFLQQNTRHSLIAEILKTGVLHGQTNTFAGKKALIEFVSANPTGPLHVGHGRGAAYGAAVADLLEAVGYKVDREYYVNDVGRQTDILAASIYLRYLEENGQSIQFPKEAYQGDYIYSIARDLKKEHADSLIHEIQNTDTGNPEQQLDLLIDDLKTRLGDRYSIFHQTGLDAILDTIKQDLNEFGVLFDNWFIESSLFDQQRVSEVLEILEVGGRIYEKNGAKWFRSKMSGDEKDRVIVRNNGQNTYFASDIAYHHDKFQRGYDKIIDIWGADHHGYMARMRAALEALGDDNGKLDILLMQFVSLFRGKQKIQMSTRSGQFITLSELYKEVGRDAARFFYVMRKSEHHLDFDLDLAKSSNKENPVFYIQYAHARICRLQDKLQQQNINFVWQDNIHTLELLTEDKEQQLLNKLSSYKETIEKAAITYAPHILVYYLKELSGDFHTYYETHRIIDTDADMRAARLCLSLAIKQIIHNGLTLLGVSAPEKM